MVQMNIVSKTLERIKAKREALGLSQMEAGERVGIDQRTWSRLERGVTNIDLETLERIALALEERPQDLVEEALDETPSEKDIAARLSSLSEEDRQEILALIQFKQRRAAKQLKNQVAVLKRAGGDGQTLKRNNGDGQ